MRHRVGLVTEVHDGVGNASRDIDEGKIAEFAIGLVEACRELCGEFKYEPRAFARDLAESWIGHLGDFAFNSRSHPGAACWLLVEKTHFAEELTLVQVRQHHFVAVFILDHHLDRSVDDVIQHIGQITGVDHNCLGRDSPYATVAQESIDCWYVAQGLRCILHGVFL